MERDEFLIAVGQHRALSLVRTSQGGEAKAAGKKKEKKNDNFFSLAAYDHNCTPPFFSPSVSLPQQSSGRL